MADCGSCCPAMNKPSPRVLNLDHFSILFENDDLCIARCKICGRWLVNEGSCWEPLLQQEAVANRRRIL